MGRTKSARATAVRRALAAKQERDAKRLERERAIEEALADFYEYTEQAAQIRQQAAERAQRIIAAAENEMILPRQKAAEAIVRLHALGETRTAIADLTGLAPVEVRETLADRHMEQPDEQPANQQTLVVSVSSEGRRPAADHVVVPRETNEPVGESEGEEQREYGVIVTDEIPMPVSELRGPVRP
jgi:hypothetical protein